MSHVRHLHEVELDTDAVVTIGVFDGVHTGHQTLVKHLVAKARSSGRQSVVLTFFPHPDKVLCDIETRYYLTSPEQRARLLLDLGVDVVVTHPFDDSIRRMPAADFIRQLTRYLRLKELWVGSDFAMGYQREGTVEYLEAQGKEFGFSVTAIELIMTGAGGDAVHSSQVRELLGRGDMRQVKRLLGRAYTLEGLVVAGQKRGRTIGFPTANLDVWSEQIIPPNGVYAGYATVKGETIQAATNIGIRPTFDADALSIEAHLLDFDRDIYGETIELGFEQRLRAEKKFAGLEALVAQISADVAEARAVLDNLQPC